MRIATMSVTKITRSRSSRLRLMRIVLIKVTLELVDFGRSHGWFRKRPMAVIRSSMSMIIFLLDHEMVGEGVRGKAGESADSDLCGAGYFCRVVWL